MVNSWGKMMPLPSNVNWQFFYNIFSIKKSIFIILFTVFNVEVVESHVCHLQEKFDRNLGRLRWSLPRKERCLCQGVVAPRTPGNQHCSVVKETVDIEDLWFTDDPTPLTNRNNWKREILDDLLDRSECCKFYT